jgi:hypothetical protein
MQETFKTCPPGVILCELVLPLGGGNDPSRQASHERGGYALEVMDFLAARGYEARTIGGGDGRIGGVIARDEMVRLQQNLINVAFVRPETKTARPELFCN